MWRPTPLAIAAHSLAVTLATSAVAAGPKFGDFLSFRLLGGAQQRTDLVSSVWKPSFSIPRMSLFVDGKVMKRVGYKIHLMATKVPERSFSIDLADLHLFYRFDKALSLKLGRFKKPITRVFTPHWRFWLLPDVPLSFGAAKSLGVAGRDLGAALFGELGNGRVNYLVGVFNGLGEKVAGGRPLQVMGRIEARPLAALSLGAGVGWIPSSTLTRSTTDVAGRPVTSEEQRNLLVFAGDVVYRAGGLHARFELIGRRTAVEGKEATLGGGFYVDLAWSLPFKLGRLGRLQPVARFEMDSPELGKLGEGTKALTGGLNWIVLAQKVRFQLALRHVMGADGEEDSTTLTLQANLFTW